MKKKLTDDMFIYRGEENIVPPIELVEYEKVRYMEEMEEYLSNLKKMPKEEALEKSKANLVGSKIIQENGEFAEQYGCARKASKRKR